MNWTPRLIHIAISITVGVAVSVFTHIHWLAASFWCSAVLFLTGSMAYAEDSAPGGFDNPDGTERPLGTWFALKSLGITLVLVLIGFCFQTWLSTNVS